MKLIKSVLVAVSLALSLGVFSTSAVACEDGRTCISFGDAVSGIKEHIKMAIDGIEDNESVASVLVHIKHAKDMSKEINENDKVDIARGRANGLLKKAKSAAKKGDFSDAIGYLKEAHAKFDSLAGLRN